MFPNKQKMMDFSSDSKRTDSPGGGSSTATFPESATPLLVRVKKENDFNSAGGRPHQFKVKFSRNDHNDYTISCVGPYSVLEAIRSNLQGVFEEKVQCPVENIIIQRGEGNRNFIVPTHFPCSCISDGETLVVLCNSEKVEETFDQHDRNVHSKEKYAVFYIDTIGGRYSKTKKILRSNILKEYKFLCVYGEKGMTIAEALKRDGRFIDELGNFTLSDNENENSIFLATQEVDIVDQKEFKICLEKQTKTKAKSENQQVKQEQREKQINPPPSNISSLKPEIKSVLEVAQQDGISLKRAVEKTGSDVNIEEIYELLRQQYPKLREWMERRFPGRSLQKELNLRKENFGKIEQAFSEVYKIRKLLEMGESVCKILVEGFCQGTGFVLFDQYIMTNAHLFDNCVEGNRLHEGVKVYVVFNCEVPEPETDLFYCTGKETFIDFDRNLDYAVLELNPEAQKPNEEPQSIKVPPGLLESFGPLPQNGEACIIGHPEGQVKKIDLTWIIEKENRETAVDDHLHPYKNTLFTLLSVKETLTNQGIENIMCSGSKADSVSTYNTFLYHGASGSPVIDCHGRVFGLHTAGYTYGLKNFEKNVIEYANRLLTIFEHFVRSLKKSGNNELLVRVKEVAQRNSHLKKIIVSDELSDSDEPMDLD